MNPHAWNASKAISRITKITWRFHHWWKITKITGSFTGSNFGFGAVLIGEGASVANSHINVAGGERITGDNLAKEVIYDITPETVVATSGNIYVFKVQGH